MAAICKTQDITKNIQFVQRRGLTRILKIHNIYSFGLLRSGLFCGLEIVCKADF